LACGPREGSGPARKKKKKGGRKGGGPAVAVLGRGERWAARAGKKGRERERVWRVFFPLLFKFFSNLFQTLFKFKSFTQIFTIIFHNYF
jgi:hypothetical protein